MLLKRLAPFATGRSRQIREPLFRFADRCAAPPTPIGRDASRRPPRPHRHRHRQRDDGATSGKSLMLANGIISGVTN